MSVVKVVWNQRKQKIQERKGKKRNTKQNHKNIKNWREEEEAVAVMMVNYGLESHGGH